MFLISIFEKIYVSSANILHTDVIPSGKSFIYIRNSKGPRTESCGTPATMFSHEDDSPFKTTLWLRSFK